MAKLDLLPLVVARTTRLLDGAPQSDRIASGLQRAAGDAEKALRDPEYAGWHFRSVLTRLLRAHQAATLLHAAEGEAGLAPELRAAADLLTYRYLDPHYRREEDGAHAGRVGALLGDDV
jgi:hypothetical protein